MRRATASQRTLIVDILSKSFDDNRSVNYVVKQDTKRKERIKGLMDYSISVCDAFGDVWISDDDQACALVLLPDKKKTTLSAITWDVKLAFSVIGLGRVGKVLGRESKVKSFHPKEPFSYLWFIGVKPEAQGKGSGSQVLQEIIEHSQREGRPIYLETSVERNLPWYQKHGFEIFQSLNLTYTLYMMRRNCQHA
jgi:ribosomal protein S18 acetylase RimI-like enzyme